MKWEYKTVKLWVGVEEERVLNQLGLEGWELVHIDADMVAFLKRPNKVALAEEYDAFWRDAVERVKAKARPDGD